MKTPLMPDTKRRILCACAAILAVCLPYVRTVGFSFIRLDDPEYTFFNPFVWNGLSWENVRTAFCDFTHGGIWMPVTYVSYMLNRTLTGPGPWGYHLVNVLLHLANAFLFAALFRRLLRPRLQRDETAPSDDVLAAADFTACAAAFLWALHPVCAEPVCWIAGRKELLWVTFALVGLLRWQRGCCWSAYVCCALACLSKPTALCFPLLAWLLPSEGHRRLSALPLWLMGLATGCIALYSQSHAAGFVPDGLFATPWYARCATAFAATGLHLLHAFVPCGLRLDYTLTTLERCLGVCITVAGIAVPPVLLLRKPNGTTVGRIFSLHGQAPFLRGGLAFVCLLLPTLGIFGKFGEQQTADRFAYAPLALVMLGAVAGVTRFAALRATGSSKARRRMAVGGIALVLAGITGSVAGAWRNDLTLFSRVLRFEPANGRALCHVASETCAREGNLNKGIALYRRSLAVRPRFDTRAQLAYALARRGGTGDAAEIYALGSAVRANPALDRKGMMLEALGRAAAELGRDDEARAYLKASIRAPARFYPATEAKALLRDLGGR